MRTQPLLRCLWLVAAAASCGQPAAVPGPDGLLCSCPVDGSVDATASDGATGANDAGAEVTVGIDAPDVAADIAPFSCVGTADGVHCDDGDPCTSNDHCANNACTGSGTRICDDGNRCTHDSCDPAGPGCIYLPQAATCEDGDGCTANDYCSNGVCVAGNGPPCDDGNPCTTQTCDPASGCKYKKLGPSTVCQIAGCTAGGYQSQGTCNAGVCDVGPLLSCDDDNDCTLDTCDANIAGCNHSNLVNQICDDANVCTVKDLCSNGQCAGTQVTGVTPLCDDANVCTIDACDPVQGCVHTPVVNDFTCQDAKCDATTYVPGAACQNGVCKVEAALSPCNDNNFCTDDWCEAGSGCLHKFHVGVCDDGDLCTTASVCAADACTAQAKLSCNDNNPCTNEVCLPQTGCVFGAVTGGCDDGNACTAVGGEVCVGTGCTAGAPTNCDDSNACTADTCDPLLGCQHSNLVKPCDDGSKCTDADACLNGKCTGTPVGGLFCDDNNPCTQDTCDPSSGCSHTKLGSSTECVPAMCANGFFRAAATCNAGACTNPPAQIPCDDGNFCTSDSCNPAQGCTHTPQPNKPCNDNSFCTTADACSVVGLSATCTGTLVNCSDNDLCTTDSCTAADGCLHANSTGNPCDDGKPCTSGDKCASGVCQGGAVACDDNNSCTADACQAVGGGCGHSYLNQPCNDGNACTQGDTCVNSLCVANPKVCNDANPCTNDSCDPAKGCTVTDNAAACDDNSGCTVKDVCKAGTCSGGVPLCNDNVTCTTDSCNKFSLTCQYTPANSKCDDGNVCTTDVCQLWGCDYGFAPLDTPCDDNRPCTLNDHCVLKSCWGDSTFFAEDSQIATKDVLMLPDDTVIAVGHNKAGKAAALRSKQDHAAQWFKSYDAGNGLARAVTGYNGDFVWVGYHVANSKWTGIAQRTALDGAPVWHKTFTGGHVWLHDVAALPATDGLVVAKVSYWTTAQNYRWAYVVRLGDDGAQLWETQLPDTYDDGVAIKPSLVVAAAPDGSIYASAYIGAPQITVWKLNKDNGAVAWQKSIGYYGTPLDIAADASGVWVVGNSTTAWPGFLARLDPTGTVKVNTTKAGNGADFPSLLSIGLVGDGTAWVANSYWPPFPALMRIDGNLNIQTGLPLVGPGSPAPYLGRLSVGKTGAIGYNAGGYGKASALGWGDCASAGQCWDKGLSFCDDGNPCTLDTCVPATGGCTHAKIVGAGCP